MSERVAVPSPEATITVRDRAAPSSPTWQGRQLRSLSSYSFVVAYLEVLLRLLRPVVDATSYVAIHYAGSNRRIGRQTSGLQRC